MNTEQPPADSPDYDACFLALPDHVQRGYMDWHPSLTTIARQFMAPDDEDTILLESKITKQELLEVADLKRMEMEIRNRRKNDASPGFFQKEYKALQKTKEQNGASDVLLKKTLALSIVTAEETYSTEEKPFSMWETQRIGLLRFTTNLAQPDNPGIVGEMRTGMGKTDVVGILLLPVARMAYGHVDMTSRTGFVARKNMVRFGPLAKKLGITCAELTEQGSSVPVPWSNNVFDYYLNQDIAAIKTDVTFGTRKNLALYMLKRFHTGSYSGLLEMTRGGRASITDEIDAEELDEARTRFIIAGKEIPTEQIVGLLWKPDMYPGRDPQAPASGVLAEYLDQTTFNNLLQKVTQVISTHSAEQAFTKANIPADSSLLLGYALIQKLASYMPVAIAQDKHQKAWGGKLFTPDGSLTTRGDIVLLQSLYTECTGHTLGPNDPMPREWRDFLNTIIPGHIMNVFNLVMKLEKGKDYFVKENEIRLQSPYTGWPQVGQEYEPLVSFMLYIKEQANGETVVLPQMLHDTDDQLTPAEFDALMYAKTIGLTGTGLTAANWFRRKRGLNVTAIPPQFPERIQTKNAYQAIESGEREDKLAALSTMLKSESGYTPVLINIETKEDQDAAKEYLEAHHPGESFFILRADNADQAAAVFAQAGMIQIRIITDMAGREIDIPVDEMAERLGGLKIFSMAPSILRRQELQLIGRTGRAGRQGAYKCLVSENDPVFQFLSQDERRTLARAIKRHDQKTLEFMIRRGQQKTEERLAEQNEWAIHAYAPLVLIRRQLAAVDAEGNLRMQDDDFKALNIFWKGFLLALDTKARALFLHAQPLLETSLRDKLWNTHVVSVFNDALVLSKHLSLQTNPPLSFESVERKVLELLQERLGEGVGFDSSLNSKRAKKPKARKARPTS